MKGCWLALLCNLQQRAVDLRLVFNETSIMECTLGPISGPRAEVAYNLLCSFHENMLWFDQFLANATFKCYTSGPLMPKNLLQRIFFLNPLIY
jgi:hypothetical protein